MSNFPANEAVNIKYFNYQALPVIGPFVVSPVVAVASAVQILAGGILASIGKLKNVVTGSESELYKKGIFHLKDGGIDLAYSVFNTCTLGFSGAICVLVTLTWTML